ncbi:hypothetical protein Slin15195_G120550 [Septoria linicola]|uniref:Uncharacterized protein n=1 Tax=Septoria linicola TaxID=215465 RepID=A0A9Q9B9C9_9PEZI|nr:hypothetical protein Slin15195_G120550 [Septoria linicola]
MAPARADSDGSKYTPPSLEEIIFSCGICQATVSELYPPDADNPHSHSGDDDGMGTKLWIANCVHIFCGRHLDGGGVPFHSSNEPPQAICPVCVRLENNHEVRNLYGIRGLTEGKLDSAIPIAYTRCPPVSLDGNDPGAEALRFQYSRLKTYSQEVTRRWKSADRKRRAVEGTLHKDREQHRSLEAQHEELKTRHAGINKKLQGWEDRKSQIKHYMGAVGEMARDIQTMRNELVKLGYHIEHKTYGLEAGPSSQAKQQPLSQSIRGDSSATLVEEQRRTSSLKPKRQEYDAYPDDKDVEQELAHDDASAMPPPPAPGYRAQPLMRPAALPPPSTRSMRSPLLDRHGSTTQGGLHSSQATLAYTGNGGRSGIPATSRRRPENSVPTMRSMQLNSGAPSFAPPSDAIDPPRRRDNAAQQAFDRGPASRKWPAQPPPLRPAGLYSQRHTGKDLRNFGPSPADVMDVDPVQQDCVQQSDVYGDHRKSYGEFPHSQRPAAPPSGHIAFGQESHPYSTRNQSILPPPPRRIVEQPGSSVLSPFFKSNVAGSQFGTLPSLSTRGSTQRRENVSREYGLAPSRSARSQALQLDTAMMQGPATSTSTTQYPAQEPQRTYGGQQTSQYSQQVPQGRSYDQSQGQIHSQSTYGRPAPEMPQERSQMPPPAVQPYRLGRMTLPPPSSSRRRWDPQVSQIRGVRGAGPSTSSQYARQGAAPYSARGSLYSQAGGRSVVRR